MEIIKNLKERESLMKHPNIYVFVDALGWEIVQKYQFLADILPFRYPVKMQFGYSSTAIPTILSGEYPRVHNHFSFYYYDPENSPFKFFKLLKYCFGLGHHPRSLLNRGRIRRYISKFVAWLYGYTGYFQLYEVPYDKLPYLNYCEKTDIFEKNGLAPIKNLRDILEESKLYFHISNWRHSEIQNINEAEKALLNDNVDFAFIYMAAFDGFLHEHVQDEKAIFERLKEYEIHIRTLLSHLEESGIVPKFTIISDHGMTVKTGTVDIIKKIESLGLQFGIDYAAVYDSTMARFWYLNSQAKVKIRERLCQSDCKGTFVTNEEKVSYGIDFDKNLFGDDIFLMTSGIQIEPSDLGKKALNGMHGFSPEDKDSYAAFLSNTPPHFIPREVRDYFHLMKADIDKADNNRICIEHTIKNR